MDANWNGCYHFGFLDSQYCVVPRLFPIQRPIMETPRDIQKKIRHLELRTRGLVETALAGRYRSVFKGRGMNFEEVREYQPGDEVRTIDWNVTARLGEVHGKAFVKKFTEERELTVMLIVDVSAS